jgi:type II secretory pathway component GspD/PulD (secretin)
MMTDRRGPHNGVLQGDVAMLAVTGRRTLLGLLLLLAGVGTLLSAGAAQTGPGAKSGDGKTKRVVYVVKYGSAKDLAAALNKYFKGEAEAVLDAGGNVLLINAPAAVFDELIQALAQLDRRPQTVALEVTLVEVPPRRTADGKLEAGDKDFDEKDLTGPVDAVANHLKALQKKGAVGSVQRFQMTTLENQATSMLQGETKPVVTGITKLATGASSRSITYRNVGTSVQATPRLGADKSVLLELRIEESRLFTPDDGVVLGMDDRGMPIIMADVVHAKFSGTLQLTPGQAVLAQGVQTTSKSGKVRTLVIVSARVIP